MAHTYNHIRTETSSYNHHRTLRDDLDTLAHSRALKVTGAIGVASVGSLLAFNLANGLAAEKTEPTFDHTATVTAAHLEEGARIRHSPSTSNEPPIKTLDHAISVPTNDGVYIKTEFRNGTWVGIPAADIPDFDPQFDDDGIVWVNQQKVSTESDTAK